MFRVRKPSGGEDFSLTPTLSPRTVQIRVHDLDLGDILQQSAAEIGEGTFQPTVVGNGRDRSLLGCCASGGMSEFAGRKHSGLKYDR